MYAACSDDVGFVALGESTTRGLWVTLSCEGLEGASQRFIIDGNARASRTAFLARRSGIQDDIASCIRDHLQQFNVNVTVKMERARPRTRTQYTRIRTEF